MTAVYFFLQFLVIKTLDPDWILNRIQIRIQCIRIHTSDKKRLNTLVSMDN